MLLESGRIDAYGAADFTPQSPTSLWIKMHALKICDRILREIDDAVEERLGKVPRHIHNPKSPGLPPRDGDGNPTLF